MPKVNTSGAFDNSALKTNSIVGGIWREKDIIGKVGVVTFTNGGCEKEIRG